MTMTNPPGANAPPGSAQTSGAGQNSTTDAAREQAGAMSQTAVSAGGQVASSAAEQAKQVAAEAQRQARDLVGEAGSQVKEQAGAQQKKAADGIRGLGDELHAMAQNSGQSGLASELAHQAGERAQNLAGWLEQRDPGGLVEEVRQFARRKPGAFLIGAAVAGVVAGRLTRGAVAAGGSDGGADGGTNYPEPAAMSGQAPTPAPGAAVPPDTAQTFPGQDAATTRDPATEPLAVEPERATGAHARDAFGETR